MKTNPKLTRRMLAAARMNSRRWLLFAALLSAGLRHEAVRTQAATNGSPVAANVATPAGTNTYIFTLQPAADADAFASDHGLTPVRRYRYALNGFSARVDARRVPALQQDARAIAVEPDGEVRPAWEIVEFPNYQTIGKDFIRMGLTNFPLSQPVGHDHFIDVNVAVLDTGIWPRNDLDIAHSVNIAEPGLEGADFYGHGTHVAGIIGAKDDSATILGVAPGVHLWSVKVFRPSGVGTWEDFLAGTDYVVQHADEIEVANASIEGQPTNEPNFIALEVAISNVVAQGIVFVAAAGNGSQDIYGAGLTYGNTNNVFPAASPEALTVSGIDSSTDQFPDFSNHSRSVVSNNPVHSPGLGIDLAAPGCDVLSTYIYDDSLGAIMSGTSMSAAYVSGLVALYIAANGRAHNADDVHRIRQALIDNGLPQSQWRTATTLDPDGHPEPLAVASENWIPKPRISSQRTTDTNMVLQFTAVPYYAYTVEQRDSLQTGAWTACATTNVLGKAKPVSVSLPAPATENRFYRLVRTP